MVMVSEFQDPSNVFSKHVPPQKHEFALQRGQFLAIACVGCRWHTPAFFQYDLANNPSHRRCDDCNRKSLVYAIGHMAEETKVLPRRRWYMRERSITEMRFVIDEVLFPSDPRLVHYFKEREQNNLSDTSDRSTARIIKATSDRDDRLNYYVKTSVQVLRNLLKAKLGSNSTELFTEEQRDIFNETMRYMEEMARFMGLPFSTTDLSGQYIDPKNGARWSYSTVDYLESMIKYFERIESRWEGPDGAPTDETQAIAEIIARLRKIVATEKEYNIDRVMGVIRPF